MKFILILLMLFSYPALADDDSSSSTRDDNSSGSKNSLVAPVSNTLYAEECGACHFAYQPGLLPARSWRKIMANLANHFEENAELETKEQQTLTDYLVNNAADSSNKITRSLPKAKTPLRITEMPYIVHEHDELSPKMVTENPKVKSLSYCDKCHTRAASGSYSEDDIVVPGLGSWEEHEHSSSFLGGIKQSAKNLYKSIFGE